MHSNPAVTDVKAFEEAFKMSDVLSLSVLTAESVQNNEYNLQNVRYQTEAPQNDVYLVTTRTPPSILTTSVWAQALIYEIIIVANLFQQGANKEKTRKHEHRFNLTLTS